MRRIVHDINGHTGRPRPRRHGNADLAAAGAKHRDDTAQIGRAGIGVHTLNARCGGGIKTGDRKVAVGRMPAYARVRRKQQAQPGPNRIARSDQKDRTSMQIEKDREEFHSALRSPSSGLTEIIFYLCILQGD